MNFTASVEFSRAVMVFVSFPEIIVMILVLLWLQSFVGFLTIQTKNSCLCRQAKTLRAFFRPAPLDVCFPSLTSE